MTESKDSNDRNPQGSRSPVGTAVVGVGYWGPNFVRTLDELPDAELFTVCDADPQRLSPLAAKYPRVNYVTSVEKVWNDPRIEAVVLATGATSHYALTMEALEAGKHVLVEKPMAMTSSEGEEMRAKAQACGRQLLVGHLLLYHPAVRRMRRYVADGELGDLLYVYSTRVNLGKVRRDESALWSFGPHDVSVVLYLADAFPVEVRAMGESYISPGVWDVVFLHLKFPGQVMAHIHVSWLDPHKVRKFTVVGKEKMAVLDDTEAREKVRVYDKGINFPPTYGDYAESLTVRVGDIHIPRLDTTEPLRVECQHLVDCVRGVAQPQTGADAGIAVLRVLEAADRSLEEGGRPISMVQEETTA